MRKIFTGILLTVFCITAAAQAPDWVTNRPVSAKEYVGIGMAPLSDPDYVKKASQNALADIATQISLKLENNSLMQRIDVDGKSREMLEDEIRNSAEAWIEGHELVDSYQSADRYYVYYTLNRAAYAKKAETRRQQALRTGLDYLQKGRWEEESMNLSQAAMLYVKGLEAVEPWTFMDLTTKMDGQTVNVPIELYDACVNLLGGMAITTNVVNLEGEVFKAVATPLAACLSRNGAVVPNVRLKAYFAKGDGVISPAIETDYTGTAEFYVSNITSKEEIQEVRIEMDESFFGKFPEVYRQLFMNQTLPSAKITISLKAAPVTAYFYVKEQHDIEGIEDRIKTILTNNHFAVTDNTEEADCFIELSTKMDMGEVVTGGVSDLNSYYCSLTLNFYNNRTEQLVLDYSVNNVKVLLPVTKSVKESFSACAREVMKRVNRELPNQIKKLKIN